MSPRVKVSILPRKVSAQVTSRYGLWWPERLEAVWEDECGFETSRRKG